MKNVTWKVATGKGEAKESWEIPGVEFEASDLTISISPEASKYLTAESALSLINRQYATDCANDSRREKTAGAPKRVETEGMIRVLMSLGMTREQAEEKVAEARRAA